MDDQLAWDDLVEHGVLSNGYLLADDGLNVTRSSFVCALLARLPGVVRRATPGIELEHSAPRSYDFSRVGPTESLAADRGQP